MKTSDRPLYAVDAGGSTTSVAAFDGIRWTGPSVNPSSVGPEKSARHLRNVLDDIRRHADRSGRGAKPAIWLASASLSPRSPGHEVRRIGGMAREAGLSGELVVSNDVTPLVLTPSADIGRVVTVCGTGSGFVASDGHRPPAQIGGCEYLGSDEGSAFDLGLRGLRAAVRGLDGRAPFTTLTGLLEAEAEAPMRDLARALAAEPFPKTCVAALAPIVMRAWLGGDTVATDLVRSAISELVLGVKAVRDLASLLPGWCLSVTGGVMTACPEFYDQFAAQAGEPLGAASVMLVADPAAEVLSTLARLTTSDGIWLPGPWLGKHAWHIDLGDNNRGNRQGGGRPAR